MQSVQHCLYLPMSSNDDDEDGGDERLVLLPADVALKMTLSLLVVMKKLKGKGEKTRIIFLK